MNRNQLLSFRNSLFTSAFLISVFAPGILSAQEVFHNAGATMIINPGAKVVVNGIMQNDGGSMADKGSITNNGLVYTRTTPSTSPRNNFAPYGPGSYMISNSGTSKGSGEYHVEQDWINNGGVFQGEQSTVYMDNALGVVQLIQGPTVTVFNSLSLFIGGPASVNLEVNAETGSGGKLDLNARELSTGAFTMTVNNTAMDAIARAGVLTGGFVSSTTGGELVRMTNLSGEYLFPTGSNVGVTRYRPVTITPNEASNNAYGARLVNYDPKNAPELLSTASSSGGGINFNQNFYHAITRQDEIGKSMADIKLHYIPSVDGDWTGIGFYNNEQKLWKDAGTVSASSDAQFNILDRGSWAFARPEDKHFILKTIDEGGGIDSIPNIMTLGGDGLNDFLSFKNANVKQFEIQIFNRWGVLLFESKSSEINWDGKTLAGVDVTAGTYYYIVTATTLTDTEIKKTGFVTLVK